MNAGCPHTNTHLRGSCGSDTKHTETECSQSFFIHSFHCNQPFLLDTGAQQAADKKQTNNGNMAKRDREAKSHTVWR